MTATVEARADILDYIAHWVEYRAWRLRIPGVQLAVHLDGDVRLSRAFGVADLDTGMPLRVDHRFRIASHSKWFTATAVLRLVQDGRLRLDDELGSLVPAYAGSGVAGITVAELLSHSAGVIRDGIDADFWQFGAPYPDDAALAAMVEDAGIVTAPYVAFKYTNVGYSLLGTVITAVTGRSYAEHLQRAVLDPLGLDEISADFDERRREEFATGHSGFHTARERRTLPHVSTGAFAAATGLSGTAESLVRFAASQFDGDERVLDERGKRLQRRPVWRSDPAVENSKQYGLGVIIDDISGHRVYGHSGGFPGFITNTLFDPEQRLAVAVLTNAIDGAAGELAGGIMRLLDAAAAPESVAHAEGVDLDSFTGRYVNLWGVVDIARAGKRLIAISPGDADPVVSPDALRVLDADTLLIERGNGFGAVGERMHFSRNPDGAVMSLRGAGGMTLVPLADERERPEWGDRIGCRVTAGTGYIEGNDAEPWQARPDRTTPPSSTIARSNDVPSRRSSASTGSRPEAPGWTAGSSGTSSS